MVNNWTGRTNVIIPPVYEVYRGYIVFVYRGYIVFAFSVRMFVCVSVCLSVCLPVNFFPSNISQKLLDLGFWNLVQTSGMTSCTVYQSISHIWLISPFICPFFFLSNKIFCYKFLSFYFRQGLKILYTWWGQPNVLLKTKLRCWDLFLPSFSIFPFSISHSKVMNMEISVKDFSGTTWPRILKFGTKLGNEQLYCVLKNQPHIAYQFLYLSFFLSL